jgi:hypothetical protein
MDKVTNLFIDSYILPLKSIFLKDILFYTPTAELSNLGAKRASERHFVLIIRPKLCGLNFYFVFFVRGCPFWWIVVQWKYRTKLPEGV